MKRSWDYSREAEQVEQMARQISLWSDKQELMNQAQMLRRRAEEAAERTESKGCVSADLHQFDWRIL